MTSYNLDTIRCTGCGSTLATMVVASCNTFDAEFFTDGFIEGPMYDSGSALLECPKCAAIFWRKDNTLDSRPSRYDSALPRAHKITDYPALLLKAPWRTAEEEKYVRIRAWWDLNRWRRRDTGTDKVIIQEEMPRDLDPFHKGLYELSRRDAGSGPYGDLSEIAQKNLERLLELLNYTNANEVVMRGEILRELGRFQECLTLLDQPFDEGYIKVVCMIITLAQEGKRYVCRII